ncbi:hypothetical protein Amac_092850 [Acrocarpospora macrocephala]|uniref:Uncharacterized protein n=1 Tax=Acrocarpospora macrocephala TaxID=150177 RepID=A0A5M3X1S8_9ACTN|nr:hypothetical protein Amac_092850 [Acrocarpospora macrocephala]
MLATMGTGTALAQAATSMSLRHANCTWPLCGSVHNETSNYIQVSQNYTSGGGCVGPYAGVAPGASSYNNPYKDTDCVRSNFCNFSVIGRFNTFRGAMYQWVRIHNEPTDYRVICIP